MKIFLMCLPSTRYSHMTEIITSVQVRTAGTIVKEIPLPSTLRVLGEGEKIPAGCDVLRLLHQDHGDIRIVWDSGDLRQIQDAKNTFNRLIEEGMVPYLVDPETGQVTVITDEFDPWAEEIVMKDDHRPRPRREVIAAPLSMLAGG